jgi:hypothetical protein
MQRFTTSMHVSGAAPSPAALLEVGDLSGLARHPRATRKAPVQVGAAPQL